MFVIERTTADTADELIDVYRNAGDAARAFCRRIRRERNVDVVARKIADGIALMEYELGTSNVVSVRRVRGYEYARDRLNAIRSRVVGAVDRIGDDELAALFGAAVDLATMLGSLIVDRAEQEAQHRG